MGLIIIRAFFASRLALLSILLAAFFRLTLNVRQAIDGWINNSEWEIVVLLDYEIWRALHLKQKYLSLLKGGLTYL